MIITLTVLTVGFFMILWVYTRNPDSKIAKYSDDPILKVVLTKYNLRLEEKFKSSQGGWTISVLDSDGKEVMSYDEDYIFTTPKYVAKRIIKLYKPDVNIKGNNNIVNCGNDNTIIINDIEEDRYE